MKLAVFVLGRDVARLESSGDFRSVMTYAPGVSGDDFVSLTMPVRTESYAWDAPLHPIFQMSLPEGYLLGVLQEKLGPVVGASPTALLSIVGRNMIGRIQVAAPGAALAEPPQSIEVGELLQGDNSEEAFAELVRTHAASGVSGVVPKFLDAHAEGLGPHQKTSLVTRRHIIKGSSRALPFLALNEHLCMQVASKILSTARTEVSADGQALVVHRFDVGADGQQKWGLEDLCSLLGLSPSAKYETTWERIAKAIRDHVPASRQRETFQDLSRLLLLTFALRNADCHSKNVALRYTSKSDVQLAPVYDLLTTSVYPGYALNPPGIMFMGKKTWAPGKTLQHFLAATFGVPVREQLVMVEAISDAVSEVAPQVRAALREHRAFEEVGQGMLRAWKDGVAGLRERRVYAMPAWSSGPAFDEPGPARARKKRRAATPSVGASPLLGKRRRTR